MSLEIPFLKASLNDHEFQLITSVAADNFAGVPALIQPAVSEVSCTLLHRAASCPALLRLAGV